MTRTTRTLTFLAALLLSAAAHAQLFRAYVASDGNDGNPCTLPQPCRLLPAALAAVASGGEIWMLDSANYNTATVTVDKSVSILAVPGAVGSVVAAGGPAFVIPSPGLSVALRNLVIVPLPGGMGTHGVYMFANSELVIEDSLVANIADSNHGVFAIGPGKVRISGTTFRKFGDGAAVRLENASSGTISRSTFTNAYGVHAVTTSVATTTRIGVTDSTFAGSPVAVWAVNTSLGSSTVISLARCAIDGAGTGIISQSTGGAASDVTLSSSSVTHASQPWFQNGVGSAVRSMGNNHFANNGPHSGDPLVPFAAQ